MNDKDKGHVLRVACKKCECIQTWISGTALSPFKCVECKHRNCISIECYKGLSETRIIPNHK